MIGQLAASVDGFSPTRNYVKSSSEQEEQLERGDVACNEYPCNFKRENIEIITLIEKEKKDRESFPTIFILIR